MTDISTLERLTKENPLDYGYWNDLGIEYKKHGRLRDAIISYLNGVNAIFQNIYLQLKNSTFNEFFGLESLGEKANHKFWLDRTWNKTYETYLNNIGVAYAEMGNNDKAKEYFREAIAFIPKGTDYPNPIIGLNELNN